MPDEVLIEFKGDYIHVRQYGRVNYKISPDMWHRIVAACEEHNCYNILGETYSPKELSFVDCFNHARLYQEAGVTWTHRIAWVHHGPDILKSAEFTETVLKNRGLINGGLFPNVQEARKWLLGEKKD